jgi:hypothetical protein
MAKKLALAGALMLALAISACAPTGPLTVAASNDATNVLAVGCPLLAAIRALDKRMSAKQKAAAATLALVCPPNPPPTSAIVALGDLLAAYSTLQPLLK